MINILDTAFNKFLQTDQEVTPEYVVAMSILLIGLVIYMIVDFRKGKSEKEDKKPK